MTVGDASYALHKAIIAKLKATTSVTAIVGQRIYDAAPPGPVKPYITMGPFDATTEVATEYEGSSTSIQVDAWSEGPETREIKNLGRAIREALHEADLNLAADNQRAVQVVVEIIRYLREPDGVTQHAVVTVGALTEPTA